MLSNSIIKLTLRILVAILAIVGVAVLVLWVFPMGTLSPQSDPATDYEIAMAKIEEVQSLDTDDINPVCESYALTHDEPTEQAFALIHGMSNCPEQWRPFATLLHEAGYNVYVPRMPYNGYADRLDERASDITAEDLAQFAEDTADILVGLGEVTTIAGLSAGGSVTTWVALNRSDIDQAVIIAPSLLGYSIPAWAERPFINALRVIPNQEFWWNSQLKEDLPGPPYAAPLIFSREAAQQFRFGQILLSLSQSTPPQTSNVLFVTNVNDVSVNPRSIENLFAYMQENSTSGSQVEMFTFPQEIGVGHDIIDPNNPNANIEEVYPQLFELMTDEPFTGEVVAQ